MEWILNLGIAIVLFLQAMGDWLVQPMVLLSQLGTETFFLVIMPAFLWCVDAAWGIRVGLTLMVSASLNHAFKLALQGPRPYWVSASVHPYSVETSFGAPSAHAQNSMAVWGMIAKWANTRLAWAGAVLLAFLIGLSRVYLGMHFPHDVLLGWVLGALIILLMTQGEKLIKPWLLRSRPAVIIAAAFAASLALILFSFVFIWAARGWTAPELWLTLSARVLEQNPDAPAINPLSPTSVVSTAATFFGLAAGAVFLRARGWYDARGQSWQLGARYLLGLVGLLAIYYGLDAVFPDGADFVALLFRYLRYFLVGLWAAFLAPELFVKIGLAHRSGQVQKAEPAKQPA